MAPSRRSLRRRVCPLCANNVQFVDYKEADQLARFVRESGKISARRKTGTCARHQRHLASAVRA